MNNSDDLNSKTRYFITKKVSVEVSTLFVCFFAYYWTCSLSLLQLSILKSTAIHFTIQFVNLSEVKNVFIKVKALVDAPKHL